ncbi:MAG: MMPL family transporter [Acidobacteriota bacterium]
MTDSSTDYWRQLIRRRGSIAALAAVAAMLFLPAVIGLETDNSPEVFFVRGSQDWRDYGDFRAAFGSDQAVRLVIGGETLWTREGLDWLGRAESQLAEIPGITQVTGLAEHYRRFEWPPRDIEAFRQSASVNPLDRAAGWIDREGRRASAVLQLAPGLGTGDVEEVLGAVREALSATAPPDGLETELLGLPVLNVELDRSSREVEQIYFPLLILFTVLLLAAAIRNLRQLLAPLLFVGLCQLLALGTLSYAGGSLNMVLSVLPPIIFVIALATALHLVLRVRHLAAGDAADPDLEAGAPHAWGESAERVFRDKGWSVFWTGVTTMVGFASLIISPVGPIRSLGIWATVGLALTTLAAFTALPAFITFSSGRRREPRIPRTEARFERRAARLGAAWARGATERRREVLVAALILSILALLGLPQLEIESNALRYLAAEHPLRTGIERLEQGGIGAAAMELLITLPASTGGAPAPFISALEVDRLADLGSALQQRSDVHGVLNAGVVLRDAMRYVPQTPMNAHLRPQLVLDDMAQDAQGREILRGLISEDRLTARSTLFISTGDADSLARIKEEARAETLALFPQAQLVFTGEYPLLLEAQRHLVSTLIGSLGLTLLAVALILRLLLPSTRLALLALLPNLWPVLAGLGLMAWTGVPLDIATVMMASVVLGLAVDDTIHTLGHFRRYARADGAARAAQKTLYATAPAYLLTGVILMAGFGVCGLSDFTPISSFGLMTAISIGFAVLGDLFLIPALLSLTPEEVCRKLGPSGAEREPG